MISDNVLHKYFLNQSFILLLVISTLALVISFCAEAIVGISPCRICLIQRACFFSVAVLAFVGIFSTMKYPIGLLLLLVSFVSFSIACYHIGIQLDFFTDSCVMASPSDLNDFKKMLFKSQPSCSTVNWIFGLPISAWSLLVSLICFVIIATALAAAKHEKSPSLL